MLVEREEGGEGVQEDLVEEGDEEAEATVAHQGDGGEETEQGGGARGGGGGDPEVGGAVGGEAEGGEHPGQAVQPPSLRKN